MILRTMTFMAACLACALVGCRQQDADGDVSRRLQRTREDIAKNYPDRELLAALDVATPTSLRTATLIRARLFGHSRRLLVEWIAAQPSATAIRLTSGAGQRWDMAIDPVYMDENRRAAETSVLFRFGASFEDDADTWSKLLNMTREGGALALLKDGQVISNEVRISLASPETSAPSAAADD